MKLNKYQIRSLKRLYDRLKPSEYVYIAGIKKDEIKISFLNFCRACFPEIGCKDTAIIEYNGITYGIESDGYCHT
jgi:hypothetical protein